MTTAPIRIGIIGGSGLYKMAELHDVVEQRVDTPFGQPSDNIITGSLNAVRVAFIPRHRRGHIYTPEEVPYCANIFALKLLGVERIIGVSACGSLREDYAPGHIVIPDQLYDNTKNRQGRSFFGDGLVAHIGAANPFCPDLSRLAAESIASSGGTVHQGGAFITIDGPRFSTKTESNVYRAWGMSLIGMTTSPEAFLAREAEMCYTVMAHVTDYDVWHESEAAVSVEMVVKTLNANTEIAQRSLGALVARLADMPRTCECQHALSTAILTDRQKIPSETLARLKPLVGKYFGLT